MPYIDNNFIDDLINAADIVDVINRRVPLKKKGADYKACCPFHNEKTPSFSVSHSKQLFKCFGCGVGGGVITFIQKYDHLDFTQSIEQLAGELNMPVIYEQNNRSPQENARLSEAQEQKKIQKELIAKVSYYYQQQLFNHPLKNNVIDYVKNRHITGIIAKRFSLGFAPPNAQDLLNHFDKSQYKNLVELGVLGQDENNPNRYYVRLRNRLIFPIHNQKGEVIAFGGRALSPEIKPKYWNSPETPLFIKNQELYGLYHVRKYSQNLTYILVVEGYMDVVSLNQHGITNAVATLGTATSINHLNILSRTVKNIVFCFDGDKAGKKAAWRALEIALPWLKKGILLKFLFLADDEDPDTLVQKIGQTKFEKFVQDNAMPLSRYFFTQLQSQVEFETREGKTEFVELAVERLQKIQYQLYRENLIDELIELSGSPRQTILNQIEQSSSKASKPTPNHLTPPVYQDMPEIPDEYLNIGIEDSHLIGNTAPTNTDINILSFPIVKAVQIVLNYPDITQKIDQKILALIKQSIHGGITLYKIISSVQLETNLDHLDNTKIIAEFKSADYFKQLQLSIDNLPITDGYPNPADRFWDCVIRLERQQNKKKYQQLSNLATGDLDKLSTQEQQEMKQLAQRHHQLEHIYNKNPKLAYN